MKLLIITLLLALLLTLASALPTKKSSCPVPSPAPSTPAKVCPTGTYEGCVNDTVCVQSWPQSCHCKNKTMQTCAEACGVPIPELAVCPPE
ncbi:hypothetical protein DFP73DRAFT_563451 [Morchella snyderi]|nr:hypothetical protein DFP73DRAFT_563451 [Morchella snyderi]